LTLGTIPGIENNIVHAIAAYNGVDLVDSPREFKASAGVGLPNRMNTVSGDSIKGVVGNYLSEDFIVKVVDMYGNPISGHDVVFAVTEGGGTLDGNVDTVVTRQTKKSGEVGVRLRLGPAAGEFNNKVKAIARDNGGTHLIGSPFTFIASATSSPARKLVRVTEENVEGTVGQQLPELIAVQANDGTGNPVKGHPITFTVTKGGGTVGSIGDSIVIALTDNNGHAQTVWTLGTTAGQNVNELQATATIEGINPLEGSPMTFLASARPDLPDSSKSTISTTGPTPADSVSTSIVTVTLADSFANRVPDRFIFFASNGEDIIHPNPVRSDTSGIAVTTVRSTRAGIKTVCAQDFEASIDIGCTQVQFTPLSAEHITQHWGNSQTGNIGTVLVDSLAVKITDRFGNGVPHQSVIFDVISGEGGAMLESQPVLSNEIGIASAHLIFGQEPGQYFVQASSPALSHQQSIIFRATAVKALPATVVKETGDGQIGPVGTPLPNPLVVEIRDVSGRPVWGVPVTFEVVVGNGYIQDSQPDSSNTYGRAQAHLILGGKAGQNTVLVRVTGLAQTVTFQATGTAGQATQLRIESGDGQEIEIGGQALLVLSSTDDHGNKVGGCAVNFEIVEGDGILSTDFATTDVNGFAYIIYTAGNTAGEHVIKASSESLNGSAVYFRVTVLAGSPAVMAYSSGNNQTGTMGRELVYPVSVVVMDRHNNPTPNVSVTFAVTAGGGSVVEQQPVTANAHGIALTRWVLGSQVGANTLIAYKSDLPPVEFTATGVLNAFPLFREMPDTMHVTEGDSLEFKIEAHDDDGDPLTYEVLAIPAGAAYNSLTNIFKWTLDYQQAGIHLAKFMVRDNQGGFDVDSVMIDVNNKNRCPSFIWWEPISENIVVTNEPITFSAQVIDADGDALTFRWYMNGALFSEMPSVVIQKSSLTSPQPIFRVEISDGECTISHTWNLILSVQLACFSAETEPFKGVRLNWQTTSETGNVGFNIYRSQRPVRHLLGGNDSNFESVNAQLISPESDGDYSFIDATAKAGQTYYYKLEDIDVNGNRTAHEVIRIDVALPKIYALDQNYPNPFNPDAHSLPIAKANAHEPSYLQYCRSRSCHPC